jgi:hypothetical protein
MSRFTAMEKSIDGIDTQIKVYEIKHGIGFSAYPALLVDIPDKFSRSTIADEYSKSPFIS